MKNYNEILEPDFYYHIYNRANGNEKLFLNDNNYNFFLQKYSHYINPIADTFAYCLMPNHFHFLVRIKNIVHISALSGFKTLTGLDLSNKLSRQFSHLFNSYTQSFNKQQNRSDSLFERPYNRKKITSEEYLKNTINYIHQNPVSHEYVVNIEDWSFSSYKAFLDNKPTYIKKQEVFDLFDDKSNFVFYHNIKNIENSASEMELNY